MMPMFNLPRPRPTVAPRPPTVVPKPPEVAPPPTSTIVPKRPDPLPTKPPEVAPEPKTTIVPKPPDWQAMQDALLKSVEQTILTQSGNDWGEEDLDDYFGTDIMAMDPNSPEFAAAIQEDTDVGPPTLPGEVDEQGWSSDFTDSGQQTSYDPEDTDEEETEGTGQSLVTGGEVGDGVGGEMDIAAPGVNMGERQVQDEGSKVSSGNLRRNIRKLAPSLINKKAKKA